MRKGLLTSMATALVGVGSALAQNPYYLPTDGPAGNVPTLLSAEPIPAPARTPTAPPSMTGGSTGLVPGLDCLPPSVPAQPRFYGDVSYMLTWVKDGRNNNPLAIAAPAGAGLVPVGLGTFLANPAAPGTTTVLGGQDTTFNGQSGIRANLGMWLDCESKFGIEAGGYVIEQGSNSAAITSNGSAANPVLARPFINAGAFAIPNGPQALVIASPGFPGSISERETTRLWGYEANGVLNWRADCNRRVDLLAGFTYTDLHETLGVTSYQTNALTFANAINDDAIGTRNQFYAGQIGARSTWTFGQLSLMFSGKIAAGVNHETVDRVGTNYFNNPGVAPFTNPGGGFLAVTPNEGVVTRDKFTVGLPSQIVLNYQVNCHMSAYVGWDFIYLSAAVRPGDQIDLTYQANANGVVIRPSPAIHQTDFWANSAMAGLAFKY
jgi:Putative beta barrel porin-7 (BBP7)